MKRLLAALNPLTMMFIYFVVAPILNAIDKPVARKTYTLQLHPERPISLNTIH
ncbi:hypothetical protein V6C27_07745 [Peptococcaceae bacterium 1198_IL3148]